MNSYNERIRRELGFDLADAGRSAGVTKSTAHEPQKKSDSCEVDEPELLYFCSFETFEAWCDSRDSKA